MDSYSLYYCGVLTCRDDELICGPSKTSLNHGTYHTGFQSSFKPACRARLFSLFVLMLRLLLYIVYENSEGYGETARTRRLA